MIFAEELIKLLEASKVSFYTGVPDSILKPLSKIINKKNKKKHIVAVNEGSAVSIGIGYHLSTKKIPCIYFQNSGLGNAINPLVSIAHKNVYSIPLFLMIGWRGYPNSNDEEQHNTKGKITPDILKLLNIRYVELSKKGDLKKLSKLIKFSKKNNVPVACLVKKNNLILKSDIKKINNKSFFNISRVEFIKKLLDSINKNTKIVSTTGYTSRELDQINRKSKNPWNNFFYMVGGMGHAGAVSLGLSMFENKEIICLDGDGSILMHLGSLRTNGFFGKKNFKHIILNNNSHESVGGTETTAKTINFKFLAKSMGYKKYFIIKKNSDIKIILPQFLKSKGPSLMNVLIKEGTIKDLSRPKNFKKIKKKFIGNK